MKNKGNKKCEGDYGSKRRKLPKLVGEKRQNRLHVSGVKADVGGFFDVSVGMIR